MEVISSDEEREEKTQKEFVADFYGERYKKEEKELDSFDSIMKQFTLGSEKHIQELYDRVHPDVSAKDYGCGCPIPPQLKGKTVLDLGSGSGRDCFVLSRLVGDEGEVIGIDCGDEALELSNSFKEYHRKEFGLKRDNIRFIKGDIQDLRAAGIDTGSIDVVVSNCVINLAEDKSKVYKEVFRVLKEGGEFYISDIYSSLPIPEEMSKNEFMMSICATGAIYIPEYIDTMEKIGFLQKHIKIMEFKYLAKLEDPEAILEVLKVMDPSLITSTKVRKEIEKALESINQMEEKIKLYSITTRIIKNHSEHIHNKIIECTFLGHEHNAEYFDLDTYTRFITNKPRKIDSETFEILNSSRYNFKFEELTDEIEDDVMIKNINFEDTVKKIEDEKERMGEGTPFFDGFLEEIRLYTHQRLSITALLFAFLYFFVDRESNNYYLSLAFLTILLSEYTFRILLGRSILFFTAWKHALPALPILLDKSEKKKLENFIIGGILLILFLLNKFLFWKKMYFFEGGSVELIGKFFHEVVSFLLVVVFAVKAGLKKSISNTLL